MKHFIAACLLFIAVATQAQNVLDNKTYRVTAYKKGNNSILSVSNYAEVQSPTKIFIPNAFTPNNDGLNDTFGIKGEGIQNFRMLVYNRWGEVIFESTDPKQQWDGSYKGQPVENGSYVYEVYAKGLDNPKAGSVTVMR